MFFYIKKRLRRKLKSPSVVMFATMLATVALDLTQAIVVGIVLSLLLFISQVSRLSVVPTQVAWERMKEAGHSFNERVDGITVVYITGPLFFGASSQLVEAIERMPQCPALIFSMRGVPLIDASGLHAIEHIWQLQVKHGGLLYLTGLQPTVQSYIERAGLSNEMGPDKLLWSADQAINAAYAGLTTGTPVAVLPPADQPALTDDAELDEMPMGVVTLP